MSDHNESVNLSARRETDVKRIHWSCFTPERNGGQKGPDVEEKLESVVPDLTLGSVIYKPCDLGQVP